MTSGGQIMSTRQPEDFTRTRSQEAETCLTAAIRATCPLSLSSTLLRSPAAASSLRCCTADLETYVTEMLPAARFRPCSTGSPPPVEKGEEELRLATTQTPEGPRGSGVSPRPDVVVLTLGDAAYIGL